MKNERAVVLEMLEKIENELIVAGRTLQSKAVFFKQDTLSMKNIEKALVEVLKAQKHLKEK